MGGFSHMKRVIFAIVFAAVLSSSTIAGEVVWRSKESGVLPIPAATVPPPAVQPLAVSYAGQRQAFHVGELVTFRPTVAGGSGRVEWWWPSSATLPPGLVFDGTTGAITGRTQVAGDYLFSVLVHDLETAETTGAVARFFIES
jgi:hypothetical protein